MYGIGRINRIGAEFTACIQYVEIPLRSGFVPSATVETDRRGEQLASGLHLRRLTSLRAFAALLVFASHIRGRLPSVAVRVTQCGLIGVALFVILSGFVLAWSSDITPSKASFYLRRFAQIYPSTFVMLVVADVVPAETSAVTLHAGVIDALLLQSWLPDKINPYTLNGVSWSLSCRGSVLCSFAVADAATAEHDRSSALDDCGRVLVGGIGDGSASG